jgi:hypothetical protein
MKKAGLYALGALAGGAMGGFFGYWMKCMGGG